MIGNIKSHYFIKIIFMPIYKKRQLKLIKYNKRLQNILNVNLFHYKIFSGKYTLYKGIGIYKEFNALNDLLLYEGNYLNGQRNGKGKEYDKRGNLIYEGEYLKGKRWDGNLKNYYENGNVLFDCEYINGKINGIGYDINNNIVNFIGEGKGYIKEYNDFGDLIFEGDYLNGERNGKGKEYYFGNLIFEGHYLNGKRWNGKGYDVNNNVFYELNNGKGYVKDYKLKYEGEYLYGERNGKGKEYDFEGNLFEGNYLNDVRDGIGKEYYPNGILEYEGEYLNNNRNGKGKEYDNDGKLRFEGEYLNGMKYKGKEYDENGKLLSEGLYIEGNIFNGNGKEY